MLYWNLKVTSNVKQNYPPKQQVLWNRMSINYSYNWKKVINVVLKSEMSQYSWKNIFLQIVQLLCDRESI